MCERLAPWLIRHCVLPDKAAKLHKRGAAVVFFLNCRLHNKAETLLSSRYRNSYLFNFLIAPRWIFWNFTVLKITSAIDRAAPGSSHLHVFLQLCHSTGGQAEQNKPVLALGASCKKWSAGDKSHRRERRSAAQHDMQAWSDDSKLWIFTSSEETSPRKQQQQQLASKLP